MEEILHETQTRDVGRTMSASFSEYQCDSASEDMQISIYRDRCKQYSCDHIFNISKYFKLISMMDIPINTT